MPTFTVRPKSLSYHHAIVNGGRFVVEILQSLLEIFTVSFKASRIVTGCLRIVKIHAPNVVTLRQMINPPFRSDRRTIGVVALNISYLCVKRIEPQWFGRFRIPGLVKRSIFMTYICAILDPVLVFCPNSVHISLFIRSPVAAPGTAAWLIITPAYCPSTCSAPTIPHSANA